ncbi:MAG: NADH-quinone oxidoreductase subunit M [Anaerolineae bacterium]|nr:NADH-quinone oxidoreductase subunit M [Anaerolineae bacterium]
MSQSLLTLLIFIPVIGGAMTVACGERRRGLARMVALITSLITLGLCIPLWTGFDASLATMQFVEDHAWIDAFQIRYALGVDGFAMPLVILTAIITVLVLISAWEVIDKQVAQYFGAMLILEGFMIGVFCATDAMLFYVFFEAMLIPMFLIIGIWGGPRRVYATIKFFLYTFLGSVFMLVGLIYLYLQTVAVGDPSFAISRFQDMPLSMTAQTWLFFAFLMAFAVKIPMFPVHTWLPDAHVEAPTGGSIVLAAIMLKIGGYGFVRFSLPMAPDASAELAWLMIALSLIAVVYIGLVALVQQDMKKLIAYSSISHMGFVTLGLFIAIGLAFGRTTLDSAYLAIQGAMVQMVSHGFISAAMFAGVGVLYDRVHSREIGAYGGVTNTMPWFAALMVLFAMANSGLPGTSGFVGEFMVILASYQANGWVAAGAALTLILGAAYTLWMVKRVFFGEVANQNVEQLKDINGREAIVLGTLAGLVLLMGLYPKPLVDVMQPSVEKLAQQMTITKVPRTTTPALTPSP